MKKVTTIMIFQTTKNNGNNDKNTEKYNNENDIADDEE